MKRLFLIYVVVIAIIFLGNFLLKSPKNDYESSGFVDAPDTAFFEGDSTSDIASKKRYDQQHKRSDILKKIQELENIVHNPKGIAALDSFSKIFDLMTLSTYYGKLGFYDREFLNNEYMRLVSSELKDSFSLYMTDFYVASNFMKRGKYHESIFLLYSWIQNLINSPNMFGLGRDGMSIIYYEIYSLANCYSKAGNFDSSLFFGNVAKEFIATNERLKVAPFTHKDSVIFCDIFSIMLYNYLCINNIKEAENTALLFKSFISKNKHLSLQFYPIIEPFRAFKYIDLEEYDKADAILSDILKSYFEISPENISSFRWGEDSLENRSMFSFWYIANAYKKIFDKTNKILYAEVCKSILDKLRDNIRSHLYDYDNFYFIDLSNLIPDYLNLKAEVLHQLYIKKGLPLGELFSLFEDRKSQLLRNNLRGKDFTEATLMQHYDDYLNAKKAISLIAILSDINNFKDQYEIQNLLRIQDTAYKVKIDLEKYSSEHHDRWISTFRVLDTNDSIPLIDPVKNEVLLNFLESNNTMYVFIYYNGKYDFRKISIDSAIIKKIERFNQLINSENIDSKECDSISNKIFKTFIANNLPKNEFVKSLLIIPDGILSNIPFDALVINNGSIKKKYLIDDYTVRYDYQFPQMKKNLGEKLTMRDKENYPDLNWKEAKVNNTSILSFAPAFTKQLDFVKLFNDSILFRNFNSDQNFSNSVVNPLKFNIQESNQICSKYNSLSLSGRKATKANLQKRAKYYNVIHFASHAFVNPNNSSLSGIILNTDTSQNSNLNQTSVTLSYNSLLYQNSSILFSYELQNMNIGADLVVLSACETSVGKNLNYDGILSLAKSFRYANCNNIISTLWSVDDSSSLILMSKFYENLNHGMGKAEALAQAKRDLRRIPNYASPKYWAPFVLIGDNEPVALRNNYKTIWLWSSLIVIGSLVSVVYLRRKKKAKNYVFNSL